MAENLAELEAIFTQSGVQAKRRARAISALYGARLVENVKNHASGRPGPEIQTGEYLESIYFEVIEIGEVGTSGVVVGSNAPQAMRLEYGFQGQDALGRHYSQPPFPHFRPASDELEEQFEESMAAIADLDYVAL